jgi:hypothetical protein
MQAASNKDGGGQVTKRPAPKPNEFYKISLCKHFVSGECPFGDNCHFAHGEHELRHFPKKGQEERYVIITNKNTRRMRMLRNLQKKGQKESFLIFFIFFF